MTTFFVPQSTEQIQYKRRFSSVSWSTVYPTSLTYWMGKSFYYPFTRTETANMIEFEVTAVFEIFGLGIKGTQSYSNSYSGIYKVAEKLQNESTYIGSEDNYKFSVPV